MLFLVGIESDILRQICYEVIVSSVSNSMSRRKSIESIRAYNSYTPRLSHFYVHFRNEL